MLAAEAPKNRTEHPKLESNCGIHSFHCSTASASLKILAFTERFLHAKHAD